MALVVRDAEEDPDRPMIGLGFGGLGFTRPAVGARMYGRCRAFGFNSWSLSFPHAARRVLQATKCPLLQRSNLSVTN